MFRSRRSTLLKRLTKLRPHEAEEEVGAPALLKRLTDQQLEEIVAVLEGRGGTESVPCVLVSSRPLLAGGGKNSLAPQLVACRLWRWPGLASTSPLKRLPICQTTSAAACCCNPYHYSRVLRTEELPPLYVKALQDQLDDDSDKESEPEGAAGEKAAGGGGQEGRSASQEPGANGGADGRVWDGGGRGSGGGGRSGGLWAHVAYWELRQRVGRLFPVYEPSLHVFGGLCDGRDGLCLGLLQPSSASSEPLRRTREKIGLGVVLSHEGRTVWLHNCTEFPVFVHSATLAWAGGRASSNHVTKLPPDHCLQVFDFALAAVLRRLSPPPEDGPVDPLSIRLSFAKGWGPCYTRQFITSCPCWLEVLLVSPAKRAAAAAAASSS